MDTHTSILKIKALVIEEHRRSGVLILTETTDGPNPFYSQTATGTLLETRYTMRHLHTPYGRLDIFGSSSCHGDQRERAGAAILKRLGHECIELGGGDGPFGPRPTLYAITHVDGEPVPPYTPHASRLDYLPYADAKAQWDALASAKTST